MSAVEIRLLGGFHVLRQGAPNRRFAAQEARALLAYLACHRDRPQTREHLAGLLWPNDEPAAARRNLRQAIADLRYALGPQDDGNPPPVRGPERSLLLSSEVDYWLDVEAFDQALRRGLRAAGGERVRELSRAAQLYRGDLLSGFRLQAGEAFEVWRIGERERLSQAVIEALRTLVQALHEAGDRRRAIHFARRLVEMDPLAEEPHRELMLLYSLTGRRRRSLAQFEDLRERLDRELGVEPLKETQDLYRSILAEAPPESAAGADAEPAGPYVPLVGRAEPAQALRDSFATCVEEGARLLLIEGKAGLGKTRLAKTLLHELTAGRQATVLQGRCHSSAPPTSYRPFAEVVHGTAWEDFPAEVQRAASRPAGLLPSPHLAEPTPVGPPTVAHRDRISASIAELLTTLTQPAGRSGSRRPVILFLDDLQWIGLSTVGLLRHLLAELSDLPVWFLATWEADLAGPGHPLHGLTSWALERGRLDRLPLRRLSGEEVAEIAVSLVGDRQADELTTLLIEHGDGLPLRIVELINLLCDEGILEATASRGWAIAPSGLAAVPGLAAVGVPETLDGLILRRVQRLPTSARQLLEQAAVIGQSFDVGSLQRAAAEPVGTVEVGVELMIERWLIRHFARDWATDPRDRDLVLWARGARRGAFEFANYRTREAVYRGLGPRRRRQIHRQVATFGASSVEAKAHHWECAGAWLEAYPLLAYAAERAAGLGDRETGLIYCHKARAALDQLAAAAEGDDERSRWEERDEDLEVLEERLELDLATG